MMQRATVLCTGIGLSSWTYNATEAQKRPSLLDRAWCVSSPRVAAETVHKCHHSPSVALRVAPLLCTELTPLT